MDHFDYVKGVLHAEAVDVRTLAETYDTPLYVYSAQTLVDHYDRVAAAFGPVDTTICFSVKSCSNLSILRLLEERGAAFDVVSGGELARVLEIGADPACIVFAGVGKRDKEIAHALDVGIGWFNAESASELDNLSVIAKQKNKTATVALRINPDVDAETHLYTTTGTRETKFGVDIDRVTEVFDAFAHRPELDIAGLHVHIGSPVNRIEPFVEAVSRMLDVVDRLRRAGHAIRAINIGGGFGAHYDDIEAPPAMDYARRICPMLEGTGLAVSVEPGRSITANAGILLTRVLYTKKSGNRRFAIVDAAMTDLIRPALYGSFHFVWPVVPGLTMVPEARSADLDLPGTTMIDIVGPVCESGDFLARDRRLPTVARGDLIAVFSAGAYGFSMSSQYNSRPRAAEVLVEGKQHRLIRRRETYDDLVAPERL